MNVVPATTYPNVMPVRGGTWRTVPNILTLSRLLLVGPLVYGVLTHHRWTAFILIAAAGLDVLDGVCARRLGQVTAVGGQLDPIVDKILMASVVASLVAVHRVEMYFLIIFVARDLAVSALRYVAARRGTMIVASRIAKRKTDIQTVAAFATIYSVNAHSWGVRLLLWLAVLAAVWSGADYVLRYRAAVWSKQRSARPSSESQKHVARSMASKRTVPYPDRPADDVQRLMNQHHDDDRPSRITTMDTPRGPEQDPDGREEIRLICHGKHQFGRTGWSASGGYAESPLEEGVGELAQTCTETESQPEPPSAQASRRLG